LDEGWPPMTPMSTDDRRFDWITEKIIGCAYRVGANLGGGFLERCTRMRWL
jgi:hypothetical protein